MVVDAKYVETSGFYWFNGLHEGTYVLCYDPNWISDSECPPGSELHSGPFVVRAEEKLTPTTRLSGGPVQIDGPTVTGTASVGSTLSASTTSTTTGATFEYSWLASGEPIDLATGPSLHLEPDHLGEEISLRVTVSAPDRIARSRTTTPSLRVVEGTLLAPAPTYIGDTFVGETLTAVPGEWPEGTELGYEWVMYLDGRHTISTETTLELTSEHLDAEGISLWVTGSKAGYATTTRTVRLESVVYGAVDLQVPTLAGTPEVGATLSAETSSSTAGTRFEFQWYANGEPIANANRRNLTLTASLVGALISVKVTGYAKYHRPSSLAANASGRVAPPDWRDTSARFGPDLASRSVALSAARFEPGVTSVYLASGSRYPDAGEAMRRAAGDEPLLLTPSTRLPAAVLEELVRLKPRYIMILGGTDAVSAAIEQQLAGHALYGVHRIVDWDSASATSLPPQPSSTGTEQPVDGGTSETGSAGATTSSATPTIVDHPAIRTRVAALG